MKEMMRQFLKYFLPLLVLAFIAFTIFYVGYKIGEYKIKKECPVCVAIAPKY